MIFKHTFDQGEDYKSSTSMDFIQRYNSESSHTIDQLIRMFWSRRSLGARPVIEFAQKENNVGIDL
jgi:hypothetical protein